MNQNVELDINNLNQIDDAMNIDNNLLNEDGDDNLNLKNPDLEYMTDSDIEDPRYMPTGNVIQDQENLINPNNVDNFDNLGVPNENQMFLQTQIMNLENESILNNKNLQQLECENDQLKTQLMKNQENVKEKEGRNNEFKQLCAAFKQRFAQYEQKNNYLQEYINKLEEQLKKKNIELAESLKDKSKSESAIKNMNIFKQYENELQNEFNEKSKKLNQKYYVNLS